jgi:DNA-binding NtrC family response regulator
MIARSPPLDEIDERRAQITAAMPMVRTWEPAAGIPARLACKHDTGRNREAANAQMALGVLKNEPKIDLVFTDVVLPGDMDGYALARAINEGHPHSKIIMTSGFPGMRFSETELAKNLPLLSKPYRKQDLIRMVREVLDERSTQRVSSAPLSPGLPPHS